MAEQTEYGLPCTLSAAETRPHRHARSVASHSRTHLAHALLAINKQITDDVGKAGARKGSAPATPTRLNSSKAPFQQFQVRICLRVV